MATNTQERLLSDEFLKQAMSQGEGTETVETTDPVEAEQVTETVDTVDAPVEGKEADQTETSEVSGESENAVPAEPAKPGTPDKVLQKAQQDISAVNRKLDALLAKKEAGEELTGKEQADVKKLAEKRDELSDMLSEEYQSDPFKDTTRLAKKAVSQDQEIEQLRKSLSDELANVKQTLAEIQAEKQFDQLGKKYTGVDVRDVWKNAVTEACDTLGDDAGEQVVMRLASKWFHERAGNAAKSVAAKKEPAPKPNPMAARTPRITPGGASVSVESGGRKPTPLTGDQETDALIGGLKLEGY